MNQLMELRPQTAPLRSYAPAPTTLLQRKCACGSTPGPTGECATCRAKRLGVQRRTAGHPAPATAPPVVHEVLGSPGCPLDATTRAFMEPRFGRDFGQVRVHNAAPTMSGSVPGVSHPKDESEREADRIADAVLDAAPGSEHGPGYDFGQVRVHTDAKAAESARALGAEAFIFDRHIVFGAGHYQPSTDAGRHLLAHELTHYVQQRTTGRRVQRKLKVNGSHPEPTIAPATDPAAKLTSKQRFMMMDTLIQGLCDAFEVDPAGDVVTKTLASPDELCGHAALIELSAHPPSSSRLTTDVHDPTVRTENLISAEQGVPAASLRGLAASGTHRGESVDRITVRQYPFNGTEVSSLPAVEQDKLKFAAKYVVQNESFVDVLGHSDSVGSSSAKKDRQRRARQQSEEGSYSKWRPANDHESRPCGRLEVHPRRRVERYPAAPAATRRGPRQLAARRALIAGFPAGAQVPPPGTPTTVTRVAPPPTVPGLKASADPCEALITGGAYP
jgi:hypothetical protein